WQKHPGFFSLGDAPRVWVAPALRRELAPAFARFLEDLADLAACAPAQTEDAAGAGIICDLLPRQVLPAEGYSLRVTSAGAVLAADSAAGIRLGLQTLLQLASFQYRQPNLPCGEITDWPRYRHRWFMLDLGRAPFSLPLLKRYVRIAARLKYNGIQLHLYDNELNGCRFRNLPLGSENPFALDLAAFAELLEYAAGYGVEIIPELESWGHAGSILQHYPALYGATRLHGRGHSFGIGPETFDLLGRIYGEWLDILPDGSWFHVGLDEANWCLLPGADPAVYQRFNLVRQIYTLAGEEAARRGKRIRFAMWHDHKIKNMDQYIPRDLWPEVVTMPWNYHDKASIERQLAAFTVREAKMYLPDGRLRRPFIACSGASGFHEVGAARATYWWSTLADAMPNCIGLNVAAWATNDPDRTLFSLFAGADCAWNPEGARSVLGETLPQDDAYGMIAMAMRHWQRRFPDADPKALEKESQPSVMHGIHRWGDRYLETVAPHWMPATPRLGDQSDTEAPAMSADAPDVDQVDATMGDEGN
ncbi:MAG TPA: family 20 glycosylhydrolase, partial [Terrimicrobiaceae bacterium]|nr:family 20 glycosylhydrolase [Terrimicrobiaceae bacterium]